MTIDLKMSVGIKDCLFFVAMADARFCIASDLLHSSSRTWTKNMLHLELWQCTHYVMLYIVHAQRVTVVVESVCLSVTPN